MSPAAPAAAGAAAGGKAASGKIAAVAGLAAAAGHDAAEGWTGAMWVADASAVGPVECSDSMDAAGSCTAGA